MRVILTITSPKTKGMAPRSIAQLLNVLVLAFYTGKRFAGCVLVPQILARINRESAAPTMDMPVLLGQLGLISFWGKSTDSSYPSCLKEVSYMVVVPNTT